MMMTNNYEIGRILRAIEVELRERYYFLRDRTMARDQVSSNIRATRMHMLDDLAEVLGNAANRLDSHPTTIYESPQHLD